MTKVVKPFIRRGWPNTFGNIVYVTLKTNVSDTEYSSSLSPGLVFITTHIDDFPHWHISSDQSSGDWKCPS